MSGKIKVGGSWKLSEKVSVNVGGVWKDAKFAYVKVAGVWVKWFSALIYDNFNRTTSGSLGTTTSGTPWEAIKGTWYADGSSAKSDDAATNYSIAAIPLEANAVTSASVSPGTGVAFWVTDANSWWAAQSYVSTTTETCNCGTCYQTCSCDSCGSCRDCATVNTTCAVYATCSGTYGSGAVPGNLLSPPQSNTSCYTYSSGAYLGPRSCQRYNTAQECGPYYACAGTYACNPYACNCQTCTVNAYNLRMLKSVSGTVSTVGSDVALTSAAVSIAVSTAGSSIVATAYSDAAMTNSLGSMTVAASSPVTAPKSGIIKAPSFSSQGSTVDDFRLTI